MFNFCDRFELKKAHKTSIHFIFQDSKRSNDDVRMAENNVTPNVTPTVTPNVTPIVVCIKPRSKDDKSRDVFAEPAFPTLKR
jgi:hypothetical protein